MSLFESKSNLRACLDRAGPLGVVCLGWKIFTININYRKIESNHRNDKCVLTLAAFWTLWDRCLDLSFGQDLGSSCWMLGDTRSLTAAVAIRDSVIDARFSYLTTSRRLEHPTDCAT